MNSPSLPVAESSDTHLASLAPPSSVVQDRMVAAALFAASFAYLCLFRHYTSLEPDEGIVLQGAERILRGQLPYRDFFTFYTPGSFYLVAALFKTFGDSLALARISLAVSGAICSLITYLLSRRVCSRGVALFVALLATFAGAAYRFLVLHNWYSTLLCCLTLYAAVRLLESHRDLWAFATGTFASLTVLFEQSKGAGLYLGLAIGLLTLRFTRRAALFSKSEIASGISGGAWPILATFAYFAVHRGLGLMLQSWIWPLGHYSQANHVPYGFQNWSDAAINAIFYTGPLWIRIVKVLTISPGLLVPVLPLVAVGLLVYWVACRTARPHDEARAKYYVLVCSVLSGLLVSVVIGRADVIHFMYLTPLWFVALAWVLGSTDLRSQTLIHLRPLIFGFSIVVFGLFGLALLLSRTGNVTQMETRRGLVTFGSKDTVIEYVRAHVKPGQEMLVYPYLPLYNYLTATLSPSRYDYFQPGMNTSVQASQIIAALESHPTQPVLFEPWFPEKIANSWPATPLAAIAADPVANFIVRNYRVCQRLKSPDGWRFEFMVRKEATCP